MSQDYNLNPDGSFMSEPQILADIVANRMSLDLQKLLTFDFAPPVSAEEKRRRLLTGFNPDAYGRILFGRWIRNAYGLWDETNPHTMKSWPQIADTDGVDRHPCHPDNFSDEIVDRLVAYYRSAPEQVAA